MSKYSLQSVYLQYYSLHDREWCDKTAFKPTTGPFPTGQKSYLSASEFDHSEIRRFL